MAGISEGVGYGVPLTFCCEAVCPKIKFQTSFSHLIRCVRTGLGRIEQHRSNPVRVSSGAFQSARGRPRPLDPKAHTRSLLSTSSFGTNCWEYLNAIPVQRTGVMQFRCQDADEKRSDQDGAKSSQMGYRRSVHGNRSSQSRRQNSNHKSSSRQTRNADPTAGPKLLSRTPVSSLSGRGTAIMWFRNDLRLADNQAVCLANSAKFTVPLYVFDERLYKTLSPHGLPRTGPFRTKFLAESVLDLQSSLQSRRSDLVVRSGITEDIIAELAAEILKSGNGPVAVVAQKEVTRDETVVEEAVVQCMQSLPSATDSLSSSVAVHFIWGATLLHLDDLPFNPTGPSLPPSFTQFRNLVENSGNWKVRHEMTVPMTFRPFPPDVDLASDAIATVAKSLAADTCPNPFAATFVDPRSALAFKGGETAGNERLVDWVWNKSRLRVYFETRNESGNADFSSKFSPWLALGCISPRTIYWNCKRYEETVEKNKSTYWLVFELLTRDYFRWVAANAGARLFAWNGFTGRGQHEPDIWTISPSTYRDSDRRNFEAWVQGRTGSPFIDASMRELYSTGFMSNRGRQNVASFLIHDLKFPDWRAGAEYFESVLVDYDVSANWGNWAYLAGVGTDPRGGRRFNVVKQAKTYDAGGTFIKIWCPELSRLPTSVIHEPHVAHSRVLETGGVELGKTYPFPIVPLPKARD